MKIALTALILLSSAYCFAQITPKKGGLQMPSKMQVGERTFEEGKTQKHTGTHQRHPADAGIEQVIAKIPSKNTPIIIETYSKDIESVTLQDEIKSYLKNKGYANVKAVRQSYFEKGFKYKECSIGIFDNQQAFDIFIAPCNK